jgi:hypothetical protein
MSVAALAVSAAALFVAAGGTSWASSLISGSQIKNATITSEKIGPGQVKNVNLGSGAVTASKVSSGSLTASDLPPNTFLPANGIAVDSNELGGKPPSEYVHGSSSVLFNKILVGYGQSQKPLLDLGIGEIDGNCSTTGVPQLSFTAEVTNPNMIEWATNYSGSGDVNTANALAIGDTFTAPYVAMTPQAVTFQVAYNAGASNHLATAWTTAQDIGSIAVCLFTGEALTTG